MIIDLSKYPAEDASGVELIARNAAFHAAIAAGATWNNRNGEHIMERFDGSVARKYYSDAVPPFQSYDELGDNYVDPSDIASALCVILQYKPTTDPYKQPAAVPKAPKLSPWSPDNPPPLPCVVRKLGGRGVSSIVQTTDVSNEVVYTEAFGWVDFHDLCDDFEYTLDSGKTWSRCGWLEEVK
jgi:hypothetical protein